MNHETEDNISRVYALLLQEHNEEQIIPLSDFVCFCAAHYNIERSDAEMWLAKLQAKGMASLQYVGASCYIVNLTN